MKYLLTLVLAAGAAAAAPAQSGPDSLTTYYAGDFGYGGVIFDVTPKTDLNLTALDVNLSTTLGAEVDVYYRVGTSFGNEANPNGWVLLERVSVKGQGFDQPSWVRLSQPAPVFLAGQTYGIYLELQNVTASNTLLYTDAPSTTYSNADVELVTNCAKAAGGITSSTFAPREFNGTIYYIPQGASKPSLSAVNFVAGQTATVEFRNGTPGADALVAFSLQGAGPTSTPYGDVALSNPIRLLPGVVLDAAGAADLSQTLPAAAAGIPIWLHGIDLGGGLLTNPLAVTIR